MSSSPQQTPPPVTDDVTPPDEVLAGVPELASGSLSAYVRAWLARVRSGESGVLPVIGGLIVIIIIFQLKNSVFLSANNIINLMVQASIYVLFGIAEVFVLLLGEIDLALGFTGAIGAVFAVWITGPPHNQPWFVGVVLGLAVATVIGAVWGLLTTRLRIPSFIVTLAGLLGLQGLLIFLINKLAGQSSGGTMSVSNGVINGIAYGHMSNVLAWVVLVVVVVTYAAITVLRDRQRRSGGLVTQPVGLGFLKIAAIAVAGVVLVLVCSAGSGVPWAVPIVLAIVLGWTFLLGHTRFGRYVYAIGGNAEAARRAGINLSQIRLIAFALSSLTAGAAGIFYAARLGSISSNVDGGQYVLLAVAAAVIGGTSLFGGRGKIVHALLGGLIVATIYNGMGLLNLSAATQLMVTALVLLAAVTVDALSRRNRTTT
ncbi:sugar ABC transporter permease [Leekyejoonella antrihumi]|uniref:Xylose transport system permease protein XylH n=1 Tax=Leekyejoonella antrihumi TaxID=1660198 RepID=A0A563E1H6_9MICO|nr:ABC transporter permease [Leekyejoonella antrihumi]TWP36377.1 ABC transporter permease [Leekyejoonella antrihumi]